MKRWLDYPTQVSELEKMARLSPSSPVTRAWPELLAPQPAAKCLVCGKRPARSCGACGGVSYCGAAHQRADARWHDAVCGALRDIAEDERALAREPRGEAVAELLTRAARHNDVRVLAGWDDLLRAVPPLTPTRRRRLSDLATRPLTLASMLVALDVPSRARRTGVLAIHVMAASQRELDVPLEVWAIAAQLLPTKIRLELALVGPELPHRPSASKGEHPNIVIRARRALYGRTLWPELGQPDLVIGYDCGLVMYPSWKSTILELRGCGVPFVITSFRDWEAAAEARLLSAVRASCLLAPAANPWASLAGKRSSTIANDVSFDNAFVSAWE